MSCVRKENTQVNCLTKFENLRDINFVKELKENYISLLSSSYGPKSSLKLIRNSAGSDFLTSSSSTLLEQLSFSNPCFKFINALISAQNKTYGVNGLFTGLICSSLLLRALTLEVELSHRVIREASEYIQSALLKKLQKDLPQISFKVNIDKLDEVLCSVRSLITSKSYYIFSSKEIEHICIKIVEAFLKTLPIEGYDDFGQVNILDIEGIPAMQSKTFDGFLIRVYDSSLEDINRHIKSFSCNDIKLAIFTVPLSPEVPKTTLIEQNSNMSIKFAYISDIFKNLSDMLHKRNVKLILCQMFIHDCLKFDLEKNGFLVLDRLGTLLTDSLIKSTGCSPISSLSDVDCNFDSHIGVASALKAVTFNDKLYVNFLPKDPVQDVSLILPAVNNHVFKYLKECVNTGVFVLRELIKDPVVVPGAGCFEAFITMTLLQMRTENLTKIADIYHTTQSSINMIFCEYIETFLYLSMLPTNGNRRSSQDFFIDDESFHLWKVVSANPNCKSFTQPVTEIRDVCSCGGILKSQLSAEPHFYSILDIKNYCRSKSENPELDKFKINFLPIKGKKNFVLKIQGNSIVDPFAAKLNSIRLAFDGFSELFRLGLLVYDT
ncbi:McKusick-Kaufman/Bardet-Biedl syndromes putative chaperonin [Armadillidium nasatum]|uniref:McKusick-Kaufman/Bardet-Biedl syndromes putative chaperonin n=1 Tax=Armadillidium nasatum TaxID=96803 RepID=A0A5N5SZ41_9CRUS|nr:McKusick-Kaufman/Bardet-Biedl syndromes putative chaperonin [Armadillidium nasatum]